MAGPVGRVVVLLDLAGNTETVQCPLDIVCHRSFRAERARDSPSFLPGEGCVKIAGIEDALAFFHCMKSMGVKI